MRPMVLRGPIGISTSLPSASGSVVSREDWLLVPIFLSGDPESLACPLSLPPFPSGEFLDFKSTNLKLSLYEVRKRGIINDFTSMCSNLHPARIVVVFPGRKKHEKGEEEAV